MVVTIQILAVQFAMFLALLLAASAAHKALRWTRSADVVRQFGGFPSRLAAPALAAAIGMELGAAVLMIAPQSRAAGALVAGCLWTVYFLLIARAIVQNRREVDCGCSFGAASAPLGAFQLIRNGVLVSVALLIFAAARGGGPGVAGSQVLAGMALLALYGALDQVMGLSPLRAGEVL